MQLDSVLAELQARVRARRARGDYPVGMEEQLEAGFNALLASVHRHEMDTGRLSQQLDVVDHRLAAIVRTAPELESRLPGGSSVHAATARAIRRHTWPLTLAVQDLGQSLRDAFNEVVRLFEVQRGVDERQLNEVVGAVFDRLAVLDALVEAVADLERRMDEVERAAVPS